MPSFQNADIAVIGLAVMGQNLILNMAEHGFRVMAYNRTAERVDEFLAGPAAAFPGIGGTGSLPEMVAALRSPRKIMLMVKAGGVVDQVIDQLIPLLAEGDVIIDGGNSHPDDSARRAEMLAGKGLLYVGSGVSGGEEGARNGPSIMPGGHEMAWPLVQPIFQAIAAKTEGGEPCCDWVGPGGSGHYVKMIHNGIEYGDMQLIAEAWWLLRQVSGLDDQAIASAFTSWKTGDLDSYLIEITAQILNTREESGVLLVDRILDAAGQKGTGRWTSEAALLQGVPLTLITESVYARALSALWEERQSAAQIVRPALSGDKPATAAESAAFAQDVRDALLASKIISYAQGFMLLRSAAAENKWPLNFGGIAMMWRGGCIIRSSFLERIQEAFARDGALGSLVLDPWFEAVLHRCQPGWRRTVAAAALQGIALPTMSSALAFFDGYRSAQLPASLTQAQRDFFGAHTYERTDKPRGEFFHTDWIGSGSAARSGSYNA